MVRNYVCCIITAMVVLFGMTHVGNAADTEIALLLDGSGSISSGDFTLQLEGTAQSIEDPSVVPQNGTVSVSVIQFSNTATLEVAPTLITSQAVANNVAAAIRAITQDGGSTNTRAAIELAVSSGFSDLGTGKQIIDISTDGDPTAGGYIQSLIPFVYINDEQAAYIASAAAASAGVEALNAIGVGDVSASFLQNLVFPQPYSTPPPYDDGFVVLVDNFNEYITAIEEKITAEVQVDCEITPSASSVCANAAGLTASVADAGAGATYTWAVTGGSIDSGQGTTAITWTAGAAGTANISVEIEDAAGGPLCSDDVDVTVNALPDCTITPSASSVCANATGLTASVADAGAGATYTWAVTGGSIDSGQGTTAITWTAGAAGTANISVEITNENGCQCSDAITVTKQDCNVAIPTLSEWGMIIMSLILAGSAIWMMRRRQLT